MIICSTCSATMVKRYEGRATEPPYKWYWWCRCGHNVVGDVDAKKQELESANLRWVRANEKILETR